jgi:O-antigen/teichoic acid export membrane protein
LQHLKAYRTFFVNAVNIFAIKLFPLIATFIIQVLYSQRLPETDYGHYQNFWVRLLLLNTLACAGLPVLIVTYAPAVMKHLVSLISRKYYFLYLLWLLMVVSVFAYMETEVPLSYWLSAAIFVLYTANTLQEAVLISRSVFRETTLINFLYSAYFIAIHLYILSSDYQIDRLMLLLLGGLLAKVAANMFIVFSGNNTGIATDVVNPRRALNLWLHLGFYDMSQMVFRYFDKFIISLFLTASVSAVYYNGSQEIPLLPILLGAFGSAALVQLANRSSTKKQEKHLLLNYSSRLLSCIVLPLFLFLFTFRYELFSLVLSEKYLDSVPVFAAALLILPIRSYSFGTLLQHLNKGAAMNKGALLDMVVALSLAYPLYLLIGLPGVALSFVLGTYCQSAYYLYNTSKLLGVGMAQIIPLKNWLIKLLAFSIPLAGFYWLLKDNFTQIQMLSGGFVLMLLVMAVSFVIELRMSPAQKETENG